ncbi:glycerol-3-phosphate dehydrogenase [Pseudomaricurvus alkylphenolicus]|uniref:glycerol-3-phosphate dehydrogenase n=1 Tax=Pseudomaricurvus alkylphenolicus TaxID=1306991 RepID=UPI00197FBEB1
MAFTPIYHREANMTNSGKTTSSSADNHYDLLVVGGGVNGTGIALDAAGRGLKVLLCEMNDLASATSSNSSKLIHGGLRYLEHNEFRLVREALAEREVLLKKAPHIMNPLRFRLPHRPHLRPAWMIRAGLFLYDNLAKRATLPASHGIRFYKNSPVIDDIRRGFEYSDGWVDDARLVVLNAVGARDKGANILSRTRCVQARRIDKLWQVELEDTTAGDRRQVTAKGLVNAAGPWVSSFFDDTMEKPAPKQVRLVKGSHIIVPRIHWEPEAYILQNEDNRIVFVIPYEERFSLVGTTDVEYSGDPSQVSISEDETDYLISVVNRHFKHQIARKDIVSSYSGVRPLLEDESDSPDAVTRDYTMELDDDNGFAPLLSIFGGKITTYRKLSEAAVDQLTPWFPNMGNAWTAHEPLPGGVFDSREELSHELMQLYPWLSIHLINRYTRSYGTLTHQMLEGCKGLADMGEDFGHGLYQQEIDYLVEKEWAVDAEDVLWRRSKLGLFLSDDEKRRVQEYLAPPQEHHPHGVDRLAS